MRSVILAALLLSSPALAQGMPLNPAVTQETLSATTCLHGWTHTVRPPVAYTNALKLRFLAQSGLPSEAAQDTKLDHIIPLVLGGSPDDPRNLMLQPNAESKDKDRVEVCLARSVCSGRITLAQAQQAIWSNWRTSGRLCSGYRVIE